MPRTNEPDDIGPGGSAAQAVIPGAEPVLPNHGSTVSVQTPDFAELDALPTAGGVAALDNLLNVTVSVTAELGRTTTSIGQLLKLSVGSVVELERLVSDPVDLVAQGIRLARGEVVVVEDRFAIRIREIIDPKKRM